MNDLPIIGKPGTKYGVVYADPPWSYDNGGRTVAGGIEEQYDTMTTDQICGLAPAIHTAKNCVLYLWGTAPLVPDSLKVMAAWGFTFKTCAVWDKGVSGIGYWWLGQHEHLFVGVKGNVSPPPPDLRVSSMIRCRRGKHSRKPDYVRDKIAQWFPSVPRLEMFTRIKVHGWDGFGNQIETDLLSDLQHGQQQPTTIET